MPTCAADPGPIQRGGPTAGGALREGLTATQALSALELPTGDDLSESQATGREHPSTWRILLTQMGRRVLILVLPCHPHGKNMNATHMAAFALVLLLVVATVAGRAQTRSIDERARRVENGLLPPVVRKGQAGVGVSLLERMRHYGAPGLSIAVINAGKVEWARGY